MKHLILILLFFSCNKEPLKELENTRSINSIIYYTNQHISNQGYITYPMNQWNAIVTFTSSCRYITSDPLNQIDYNKLFGVRKNGVNNYKNGAYLVWAYVPQVNTSDGVIFDKIRIGWYLHDDDGNFEGMPIAESIYVDLNTPVQLNIYNYNAFFWFNLNGNSYYINKSEHNIDNFSNGWRLSPNFGGQETPDYNITILIN